MKILIIPYNGGKQSQATASEDGVSRTQHAAREYHRNVKLRKAQGKPSAVPTSRKKPKVSKDTSIPPFQDLNTEDLQLERPASPRTLLGASRSDPFNTGSTSDVHPYAHEMLDHALSYQWSEFRLADGPGSDLAKGELMQSVLKSPHAWYAVIFAGATHDAFQHGAFGVPKQNEQLRLYYKTKAIESLVQDISKHGDEVSEETILSMIVLASHGTGEKLKGADSAKRRDFRLPFVPHVHGVEYYSAMETGIEHLNAVYSLVDKRGGLRTIRLRSLAISIQLYDIYASWKRLKAPHFDLLAPTRYPISMRMHKVDAVAQDMLDKRTVGFNELLDSYPSLNQIVQIFDNASIFSVDFDQLIRCHHLPKEKQQPRMPNIALVKFTRWCVLHDILRIPDVEPEDVFEPEEVVFEICRLILLAYALFAVVPMPPESNLHGFIAEKLDHTLQTAVGAAIQATHPDLFLCAVGWAFMCAHKPVNHRKLGKVLRRLVRLLEHQTLVRLDNSAWPVVAEVMGSFLWLDSYCEEPGRKFWACACGIAEKDSGRD